MGVVVDTSILIAAERKDADAGSMFASFGAESITMAAITASELLHGCYRASDAAIRARRSAYVDAVLDLIPVARFGLPEARRHAQLWAELVQAGTPIGPHDMLIAATAIARGDAVATLNRSEFERVPGLHVV